MKKKEISIKDTQLTTLIEVSLKNETTLHLVTR